jgi:hypothetical protein
MGFWSFIGKMMFFNWLFGSHDHHCNSCGGSHYPHNPYDYDHDDYTYRDYYDNDLSNDNFLDDYDDFDIMDDFD